MEQSSSISTPLPSRISAASLTSQEPSGSFQPKLAASEAQCGNSSREYPTMLPDGATVSLPSIESASSAEGGDGAPAMVAGPVAGAEDEPAAPDAPLPEGRSSQGIPSPSPSRSCGSLGSRSSTAFACARVSKSAQS